MLRDMAPKDSRKLFELRDYLAEAPAIYRTNHPWNFSNQILARIPEELIVLEAPDIHWSDWGTRESIERTYRRMNLAPAWRPMDYDSGMESLRLEREASRPANIRNKSFGGEVLWR